MNVLRWRRTDNDVMFEERLECVGLAPQLVQGGVAHQVERLVGGREESVRAAELQFLRQRRHLHELDETAEASVLRQRVVDVALRRQQDLRGC